MAVEDVLTFPKQETGRAQIIYTDAQIASLGRLRVGGVYVPILVQDSEVEMELPGLVLSRLPFLNKGGRWIAPGRSAQPGEFGRKPRLVEVALDLANYGVVSYGSDEWELAQRLEEAGTDYIKKLYADAKRWGLNL